MTPAPSRPTLPYARSPVMREDFEKWAEECRIDDWAARILGPKPIVVPLDNSSLLEAAQWKARRDAFYALVRYLFKKEQMIRAVEAAKPRELRWLLAVVPDLL